MSVAKNSGLHAQRRQFVFDVDGRFFQAPGAKYFSHFG
jgi:hypothetical protein